MSTPRRKAAQLPLIESAYLKFRAPVEMLDNPPAKGDTCTFVIEATCYEIKSTDMKDGEERNVISLQVDRIWEEGQKPPGEKNQPGLFAVDGDAGDDDPDDDEQELDDEGPEFSG